MHLDGLLWIDLQDRKLVLPLVIDYAILAELDLGAVNSPRRERLPLDAMSAVTHFSNVTLHLSFWADAIASSMVLKQVIRSSVSNLRRSYRRYQSLASSTHS